MTKEGKNILLSEYDGIELCPYCGMEFCYSVKPYYNTTFKCPHCGNESTLCSLCNSHDCNGNCKKQIWESLIDFNLGLDN